jgi:hypothetical protein
VGEPQFGRMDRHCGTLGVYVLCSNIARTNGWEAMTWIHFVFANVNWLSYNTYGGGPYFKAVKIQIMDRTV